MAAGSHNELQKLEIAGEGKAVDYGTTVPTDGAAGYLTGCIFIHTDGGAGTAVYINEGTTASCDFNAIVTGAITSTTGASGSFDDNDANTITVVNGLITDLGGV